MNRPVDDHLGRLTLAEVKVGSATFDKNAEKFVDLGHDWEKVRDFSNGGGGLVALVAPAISVSGIQSIEGGLGGIASTNINSVPRIAGASGGASFGDGGFGGSIPIGGSVLPSNGGDGGSGLLATQQADPAALFM